MRVGAGARIAGLAQELALGDLDLLRRLDADVGPGLAHPRLVDDDRQQGVIVRT